MHVRPVARPARTKRESYLKKHKRTKCTVSETNNERELGKVFVLKVSGRRRTQKWMEAVAVAAAAAASKSRYVLASMRIEKTTKCKVDQK